MSETASISVPETAGEVLDALGGTTAVAEARGLSVSTVGSWKSRGGIPRGEFTWIAAFAITKGKPHIDEALLSRIHRNQTEVAQ